MVRTEIPMKNLFSSLREQWDAHLHQRYLRKMGWTERDFTLHNDPDCDRRASNTADYYHGYPHVYIFLTTRGDPWTRFGDWLEGLTEIKEWCHENCTDKWREDILRVSKQTGINADGSTEERWFISEIGGGDALFFAFKSEVDYTMFLMRWA